LRDKVKVNFIFLSFSEEQTPEEPAAAGAEYSGPVTTPGNYFTKSSMYVSEQYIIYIIKIKVFKKRFSLEEHCLI